MNWVFFGIELIPTDNMLFGYYMHVKLYRIISCFGVCTYVLTDLVRLFHCLVIFGLLLILRLSGSITSFNGSCLFIKNKLKQFPSLSFYSQFELLFWDLIKFAFWEFYYFQQSSFFYGFCLLIYYSCTSVYLLSWSNPSNHYIMYIFSKWVTLDHAFILLKYI